MQEEKSEGTEVRERNEKRKKCESEKKEEDGDFHSDDLHRGSRARITSLSLRLFGGKALPQKKKGDAVIVELVRLENTKKNVAPLQKD